MDTLGGIGTVPPLVSYFCPGRAFVIRAIKSLVASKNDLWVERIYGERREANTTVGVGAAVSPGRALCSDLNPSRPPVHGFVEVVVRIVWP